MPTPDKLGGNYIFVRGVGIRRFYTRYSLAKTPQRRRIIFGFNFLYSLKHLSL